MPEGASVTPLIAASANSGLGLAAVLILTVFAYFAACAAWPFARCGRCDGRGFHLSPTGQHLRDCRRCKGTGRRVRIGRRIYTRVLDRGDR
jgi:hypothetical protein